MTTWSFSDIPDQTGRTAIVTGANTGLGLETARMLAQKGADVVLACRSRDKGEAAVAQIRALSPAGTATFAELDLGDLDAVRTFTERFRAEHARLDLLINNAGVMIPPLTRTKQGFELQLGTNHLGHFALTGRLLPLLLGTGGARIVVLASIAQRAGSITFDDLNWERRSYSAFRAYGQSKLANMMFALELSRRLEACGSKVRALAAHPGWTATDLQRESGVARFFGKFLAMKPAEGALPTLRAATDPEAASGTYWGPEGFQEMSGPPAVAQVPRKARDERVAAKLWEVSEQLTSVRFAFPETVKLRAAS